MKFRDETERAAWSSAWDAGRLAGLAPVFCAEGANDKIEAMRTRAPDPTAAIKPEAPGTICGVKPMDPLSGLVEAMSQAPNTGGPSPLGGGRIHFAIQRGAEIAWQRMWDRRVHLSHCDADRAHVIECIYDAMIDAVVEHRVLVNTEMPGDAPVNQCAPGKPQHQRSERGALERIRKRMVESTWDDGRQIPYDEGRALAIHLIDAELARQPADELSPRVKAVVEAARAWVKSLHTDFEAESALCQAVKALDKETK